MTGPARLVAAVFAKEMAETLRDRRTLVVGLILPLILMPMVTLGVPYLAERQRHQQQTALSRVAVMGAAYAPDFMRDDESGGLIRVVTVSDPVAALLAGKIDAVLTIPQDFSTRVRSGTAQITVVFDESEPKSVTARQRLQDIVTGYAAQLAEQRLRARGLSAGDLVPIVIGWRSVADQRRLGGALLAGLLPFFIAIWAVLGGQHAALDTGAGERERRTLETLLVAPPSRWILATGKFLSVATVSLSAVVIVILITLLSLRLGAAWGVAELRRASVLISAGPAVLIVAVSALLAGFLSAALLALSLFARGVREAQQYFTPLYLMVTIPAMATPFLEGWQRSVWTYILPGLGPMFALRALLQGTLVPVHLVSTMASTALLTGLSLALAVRALRQEPSHR